MGRQGEKTRGRPFIKWAGGKTQLLQTFERFYPAELRRGEIERYVEPFVGSGAVMLDIMQRYPVEEAFIADVNPALTAAYTVIKKHVEQLIEFLLALEKEYLALGEEARQEFYYVMRERYNRLNTGLAAGGQGNGHRGGAANKPDKPGGNRPGHGIKTINCPPGEPGPAPGPETCGYGNCSREVIRTGLFLFLNRTCYNGLYRVNRSGRFNVPAGRYKKPRICDAENLRAVSRVLQRVTVLRGDYRDCARYINKTSFVYFDPPYRPLSATAGFTSYHSGNFNDRNQEELAAFFRSMDRTGALLMLSNSNPKNTDAADDFFDRLYRGFNIHSVEARRAINSRGNSRGNISELIITNY